MTDNLQQSDAKGKKVAALIIILAFAVLHALAFFIPSQTHFEGWHIAVTGLAVVFCVAICIMLLTDNEYLEVQKWPYIALIILAFASAVLIGYTPAGLSA